MGTEPHEPTASRTSRLGSLVRTIAVDGTPLRTSRDYRLLWFGELISEAGHQVTVVAMFYQVTTLTNSPAAVGLIGLVQLVPLLVASIGGGSIVDAVDRRKLLIVSQIGFALSSSILLAGALAGRPPLALIYGAAALSAGLSGIDSPTRSAMIPRLVGKDLLPAAVALNQVMWNTTAVVGPAIGGIVIGRLGLSWAYGIDVVTYGATLVAALLMRPMTPSLDHGEEPAAGWAAVKEGFRYLKGRRVLQSTFTIDLIAMIFGMPRALFAILAATQFHRGPEVVGLLFSAPAVGALIGALTAGWVGGVRRQGRAVIVAVAVWGAGITGFGLAGSNLVLGLGFLAVAGAADVISAVYRSTILHLSVPDALRGRLSGIHIMVVTGGPRVGDLEAGLVAAAFTPTISVVSGGLLCIAGAALVAALAPEFARYRAGGRT
ncbi:MAG: MFS transporter [Actinobacteria bacterium]|nr:MFS transporter [Actinomycetota bacterium]